MSLVLYIKQIKGNTDVLVSSWSLMLLQDLLFQLSISITQREKKRLKIRKNACAMSSFYINPYEQQQSHYPNCLRFTAAHYPALLTLFTPMSIFPPAVIT